MKNDIKKPLKNKQENYANNILDLSKKELTKSEKQLNKFFQ